MQRVPFNLVEAFSAVVEQGGFARAAATLNMTPSSVSRLVKALEQQLGVRLLNRTTRAMSLTEAGQRFHADSAAALAQLHGACERAAEGAAEPQGTLRVSAPVAFGRTHLVPHLAAFMMRYPQLRVDLLITDRLVDIVAERIHVAIRIGRLDDSTLVGRKLLPNRRILAAAPAYVARHGMPATVAELERHECLVSTANHDGEVWKLHGDEGERAVRPRGRVRSDNGDAVHRLAVDGMGICFRSAVSLEEDLCAGRLVQVLPAWTGKESGVYAMAPSRPMSPAARALADFLVERWSGAEAAVSQAG
ncbi:LysR family transcriptional regulator [Pseudoduganella umbonata]|uniref:DNA-binding transcriptional LysR family regulator n=1 Tax=Pseudoduganella umbonata TaxID=864828 RepID=A0A4V1ED10_9BURK|nr:LysR family transcriptional regulator [Pseudoduganella umbonata]MBB3219354.1 DNA-binding transcriptional LysR family regulator [Pseudoduganella umbonata]QCP09451.1 LysR family transcriptional regulator [Pseudoduganella umbonata]